MNTTMNNHTFDMKSWHFYIATKWGGGDSSSWYWYGTTTCSYLARLVWGIVKILLTTAFGAIAAISLSLGAIGLISIETFASMQFSMLPDNTAPYLMLLGAASWMVMFIVSVVWLGVMIIVYGGLYAFGYGILYPLALASEFVSSQRVKSSLHKASKWWPVVLWRSFKDKACSQIKFTAGGSHNEPN